MNVNTLIATIAAMLLAAPALAQGKLNVMTTTEDLASIGREVAGDRATIDFIARGYQDPHFVEAKPSFILKLQLFFFFIDTAPTEIYTLSLHDALPISLGPICSTTLRLYEMFTPGSVRTERAEGDRKSTRLNSSHLVISYAVFCLK